MGSCALGDPQGLPDLSAAQQIQLRQSQQLLLRCVQVLVAVCQGGGHSVLEQPPSAFSWQEPQVQAFLASFVQVCSIAPACCYGVDLEKSWMFASSFKPLRALGGRCPHGYGSHQSIRGVRDDQGHFLSQRAAEYPPLLASLYVQQVSVLFDTKPPSTDLDLTLPRLLSEIPAKALDARPLAVQDGGGLCSQPDWSVPRTSAVDPLGGLRKSILSFITDRSFPRRLLEHVSSGHDCAAGLCRSQVITPSP